MRELVVLVTVCATALCLTKYQAEVKEREDVTASRIKATKWLMSQRNKDWGWGTKESPETHRILTALYLSGQLENLTDSLEHQLSVRQLELELGLLISRASEGVSKGQLALYVNALLATCRDPKEFYGLNVIELMKASTALSSYADALAFLALWNSGSMPVKEDLRRLLENLDKSATGEHIFPDTTAMAALALSSAATYKQYKFVRLHLRHSLKPIKKAQKPDGSFGNVYSSALVVQALIGSKDNGRGWDFQKAMDYIISQQKEDGSFDNLLATYFVLPVLAGRSLVDLRRVKCEPYNETVEDEDLDEEGISNATINVLYIVWGRSLNQNTFVVPEGSSFYHVMVEAQKLDDIFSFNGTSYSWGFFVQEIGGLRNDPVCGKFWILYKLHGKSEMSLVENGVSKEIPKHGDAYVFKYEKTPYGSSDCDEDDQENKDFRVSLTETTGAELFENTTVAP